MKKGMWLDGQPFNNPPQTTRKNKNVVLTESYGALMNEKSFKKFLTYDKSPLGCIALDGDFVIFSVENEIGLFDSVTGIYKVIIKDDDFNFNSSYPITGVYTLNFKKERIIAFTDGLNSPKVLNIDNPYDKVSKLEMFIKTSKCEVSSSVKQGGRLRGTFNPVIQLENSDGSVSDWMIYEQLYCWDDNIVLDITGINTDFFLIRIGYVQRVEGETTAWIVSEFPVKEELSVVITGDEIKSALSLDELIPHAKYKTVKVINQFEDVLYLGNLSTWKEENQQQYAVGININWTSTKVTASQSRSVTRTFAHGEVYAFYVQYEYDWGWGQWFPIPGRTGTTAEKANSPYVEDFYVANEPDEESAGTPLFYELNDTVSVITANAEATTLGKMGFWENKNETYPDVPEYQSILVGLAGQKVRHHKFPSQRWLRKNVYGASYGCTYLDKLGIEVTNVTLPPRAKGYRIGYAKRQLNNSSFIGQSPVIYSIESFGNVNIEDDNLPSFETIPRTNISTGGNWNVEQMQTIDFPDGTIVIPTVLTNYSHLYPPELLYFKPKVNPRAVRCEYKLMVELVKEERKLGFMCKVDTQTQALSSFIVDNAATIAIKDFHYVPNNVVFKKTDNVFGDEHINFDYVLHPEKTDFVFSPVWQNLSEQNYEESFMFSLIQYKTDYYNSFLEQQIIPSEIGDCFVTEWAFNTYGRAAAKYTFDPTEFADRVDNGTRVARRCMIVSHLNLALRQEALTSTNGYTQHIDKSAPLGSSGYLDSMKRDKNPNNLQDGYDGSLNAQFDLEASLVFSPFKEFTDSLPYRIARSEVFKREGQKNNWKLFFENNYYEMPKNRGVITNIVPSSGFMLIHTQKSLFKTRGNETLQTGENNLYVGYGDIFKFDPIEVIHDELGSLGLQHHFAAQLTKWGYIFLDAEKGIVFLVGESVKEVINGMRNFFLEHSDCVGDNPYQEYGWSVGVDYYYNRILFSKKHKKIRPEYKDRFRGVWKDDINFINSLRQNDIVYKNGVYQTVNL